MDNRKLKPGDIVVRKSGSPNLTVEEVHEVDLNRFMATCRWHIREELQQEVVPCTELVVLISASAPEPTDESDLPLPSEAMRLKLMEVALKFATNAGSFVDYYEYLLRRAQQATVAGSMAFMPD